MGTSSCAAVKPNYHAEDIAAACDTLHEFDLPEHLVVDFSHGNCQNSIAASWRYVMIFASRFVMAPRQLPGLWPRVFTGRHAKIISGQPLIYGQSITDPCLNWEDTEVLLKTCRGGRQPLLIARPSCRDGRFFDALPALFSPRAYITPQN